MTATTHIFDRFASTPVACGAPATHASTDGSLKGLMTVAPVAALANPNREADLTALAERYVR